MGAFRSILVDTDATADVHPAFQQACDLAARLAARVTLVDVTEHLPSSAYNVFTRKLEADLVDDRRAALARLAQTRQDVQCKASAASETQPAKLLAVFVVDTHETELVIPFGNRGHRHSVGCPNAEAVTSIIEVSEREEILPCAQC